MLYSPRQLRVLAAVYHQADLPIHVIAQQLRLREHVVRRDLHHLLQTGLARRQAFIDVYRLGYVQYEICLSLGAQRAQRTSKFLHFLQASPRVAWIGQFSGAFQYIITVCVRTPHEIRDFMSELADQAGVALTDRQIAIRLSYTEFPLKYLSQDRLGPDALSFGMSGDERIDRLDHQILGLLSESGHPPRAQLAARLKIPHSSFNLRVRQLERRGIIAGYTYVVDFSKLGFQAYTLLLRTKSHSTALTSRLLDFCRSTPNIAFMTEDIGAFDYKIGIHLAEPSHIIQLQQRVADEFAQEIVGCSALTSYDYLKVARYPFRDFTA